MHPTELVNPRGMCETCRYFIQDKDEFIKEVEHLSVGGNVVHTKERTLNARGNVEGDKLTSVAWTWDNVVSALWQRLGLDPTMAKLSPFDLGLCEKGVAQFVFRQAGNTAATACLKWQEKSNLIRIRPTGWRTERDRQIEIAAKLKTGEKTAR